jgi:hypothetical protein
VRARICIERGKLWQAEYWIHETRDQALALACHSRGLAASYGRGLDELPAAVLESFGAALVGEVSVSALRRALAVATAGLLREASGLPDVVARVRPMVEELCS